MRALLRSALMPLVYTSLTLSIGCSSCDETGTKKPPIPPSKTNNKTNNNNGDMGDMSGDMTGDMKSDMEECEGADCVSWVAFDSCMRVRNLGTLDSMNSAQFKVAGDTTNLGSTIKTSCSDTGDESAEYVYAFKLNATAFIDLKIDSLAGVDFVAEVRQGKCEEDNRLFCDQSAEELFLAKAGEQYFLAVEAQNGLVNGPFDVKMDFTPTNCTPGERACQADNLTICADGTMTQTLACGTMCSTDACTGDLCASAVEVSGMGTFEFTGNLSAFSSTFDAQDHQNCSFGNTPTPTPGAELYFNLRGLQAGQRVVIEANALGEDLNDNAIFILDSCGATSACIAKEELSDKLEWEVPANGDYFVVIDNLSDVNKEYKNTITIVDP